MPKYRITTDKGTYEVTTADDQAPAQTPAVPDTQSSIGGAGLAGAGALLPSAATAVEDFATSPTAAKTLGSVARAATTVGAVGSGIASGNPTQVLAAPMEGWAAGKGGYFLGKGLQSVATPVAKALDTVAPYAQTLSTLGGAQGLLDLVQMVDPKRKDLGFLGVTLNDPHDSEHPAIINAALDYVKSKISGWEWSKFKNEMMKKGSDEVTALKQALGK